MIAFFGQEFLVLPSPAVEMRREMWRRFHGIAVARHSGEEVIPVAKQWMAHTLSGHSIHPPAITAFGATAESAMIALAARLEIPLWGGAQTP